MSERPEFKEGTFPYKIEMSEGAKEILLGLAAVVVGSKSAPAEYREDCLAFIMQTKASSRDEILITDNKGVCGYMEASMIVEHYAKEGVKLKAPSNDLFSQGKTPWSTPVAKSSVEDIIEIAEILLSSEDMVGKPREGLEELLCDLNHVANDTLTTTTQGSGLAYDALLIMALKS